MRGNMNMGVPGGAFVDARPLRTSIVGPMPSVTAGGTSVPGLVPLAPMTPAQFDAGMQYVSMGPTSGGGGAPLGTVSGLGGAAFGRMSAPFGTPGGVMALAGLQGYGRPATVYGRKNYGFIELIIAAVSTWVGRGGKEGAEDRQEHRQEIQETKVEGRQGRKDFRLTQFWNLKNLRESSQQHRKDVIVESRAEWRANRNAVDTTIPGMSDLAVQNPDGTVQQLTNREAADLEALAAAQQQQQISAMQAGAASSTEFPWGLVLAGGAAIVGVAYLAKKKKK